VRLSERLAKVRQLLGESTRKYAQNEPLNAAMELAMKQLDEAQVEAKKLEAEVDRKAR
jgi:hypothetical protein